MIFLRTVSEVLAVKTVKLGAIMNLAIIRPITQILLHYVHRGAYLPEDNMRYDDICLKKDHSRFLSTLNGKI